MFKNHNDTFNYVLLIGLSQIVRARRFVNFTGNITRASCVLPSVQEKYKHLIKLVLLVCNPRGLKVSWCLKAYILTKKTIGRVYILQYRPRTRPKRNMYLPLGVYSPLVSSRNNNSSIDSLFSCGSSSCTSWNLRRCISENVRFSAP